MHLKALAIYEKLGRQEGMAAAYCNLGDVYRLRGKLDEAELWLAKSLELCERLHVLEYQADAIASLGEVARDRGERARARDLWAEARDLYDRIGMKHKVQELTDWLDQLPSASDA